MSCTPRRLLVTASTLTALAAGATPAIAAPSTPLVTYLAQQTPKLRQNIGGVGSRAEELRTITDLTRDQRAANAAIHVVEHLPTKAAQQPGKKTWLEGERYAARGDSQTAAGLRLILAGHRSTGASEVNRQWRRNGNFYLFDHYNALGLRELRVPAS
jgi:hypothetical protein